ncbi:MAG: FAD-dependent thymidylate synthase [Candidatus Dojkabacteria bacterium]|jgi:hypothetical protein
MVNKRTQTAHNTGEKIEPTNQMVVELGPLTNFLLPNGKFDKKEAKLVAGRIAGACYSPKGFSDFDDEEPSKTLQRSENILESGHHSVYDHIQISLRLTNIPKILAMILNNENQYTTTERSYRYTKPTEDKSLTKTELSLYNKWFDIFVKLISKEYGNVFDERKITKLAQENARYFLTVFAPTNMTYSIPLGQLNRICKWLRDYDDKKNDAISQKLSPYINEFLKQIEELGLIIPQLQKNEKKRKLSLFATEDEKRLLWKENFGSSYSVIYTGSFVLLGHLHRHRTLDYQMYIPKKFSAYVPTLLDSFPKYRKEWIADMKLVQDTFPQGQMVDIIEQGTLSNFILKCKERLCTHVLLETQTATKNILDRFLENNSDPDILEYLKQHSKGARCTFPDYTCIQPCGFKEGVTLTRRV